MNFWIVGVLLLASLTVKVVDDAGDPLPGAEVRVTSMSGGDPRVCSRTDDDGVVVVEGMPIGVRLEVDASFPGFAVTRVTELVLEEPRTVSVELSEEVIEHVRFRCAPLVDLGRSGQSMLFHDDFLAALPGGRSAARFDPPRRRPRCRQPSSAP